MRTDPFTLALLREQLRRDDPLERAGFAHDDEVTSETVEALCEQRLGWIASSGLDEGEADVLRKACLVAAESALAFCRSRPPEAPRP